MPIAMSGADWPIIGKGEDSHLLGHTFIGRTFSAFSQPTLKKATYSKFMPTIFLNEGDRLDEYGVAASILHLPGHTAGSIAVLTDDGEIIVGDAMFNMLRPNMARIYEDKAKMDSSFIRILDSGARLVFCGHGKPVTMDRARKITD